MGVLRIRVRRMGVRRVRMRRMGVRRLRMGRVRMGRLSNRRARDKYCTFRARGEPTNMCDERPKLGRFRSQEERRF